MREIEQRDYSSRSLKLQSGYALLPFQTPGSFSALVGIHLKNGKSCLKKRPTAVSAVTDSYIKVELNTLFLAEDF